MKDHNSEKTQAQGHVLHNTFQILSEGKTIIWIRDFNWNDHAQLSLDG
jgi:hypothetical protein